MTPRRVRRSRLPGRMFCRRVTLVSLLPPSEDEDAALSLPPVAEGETEFRRRIFIVDRGQFLLVIFPEFFAVRNEAPIEIQSPAFVKRAQRNPGVVLHNNAAVFQQKIADAGESFVVHEVGSSLDQTEPRPARRAPTQKSAVASREVVLEVVQSLRMEAVAKGNLNAFRGAVDISGVDHSAAEPR